MSDLQMASRQGIQLMDLTTLNDDDSAQKVLQLCADAHSAAGDTAAICIYPRFIPIARQALNKQQTPDIKIATVCNFPEGNDDLDIAFAETRAAIAYGADEVDVVFPYRALMAGNSEIGTAMIQGCREICGKKVTLKVIIESGELQRPELIKQASQISIAAGADFIKTSTGKVPVNATLAAAKIMLETIKESGKEVGFKAAGGVKDAQATYDYLQLARDIMGNDWVNRDHFRFGASSLLVSLLSELNLTGKKNRSRRILMKRTIILLLDSFGIGSSADAEQFTGTQADGSVFSDAGANTLAHIAEQCANGQADNGRHGPLNIPNMNKLGLGHACEASSGTFPVGLDSSITPSAAYGYAKELSTAKDTSSGHWEITGVPVLFDWGYFPKKQNSFPQALLDELVKRADLPGYLGNCHSSGTIILEQLGEEHIKTGKPIFYTSADSVFQIACHEETFGLERLYNLCEIARELVNEYHIGRVIARPFNGSKSSNFARTGNRHDYSVVPPAPTLLDKMKESGGQVVSIGKISDIFAAQGISKATKANGIEALFDASLNELQQAEEETIIFTNFVNFDADFGHRRDVCGYASALEYFDKRLPEMLALLGDDDLLVIAADHGCDPTWAGTDHTREHIPVIFYGKNVPAGPLGERDSFADIGQSIADYHHLPKLDYGQSIFKK